MYMYMHMIVHDIVNMVLVPRQFCAGRFKYCWEVEAPFLSTYMYMYLLEQYHCCSIRCGHVNSAYPQHKHVVYYCVYSV